MKSNSRQSNQWFFYANESKRAAKLIYSRQKAEDDDVGGKSREGSFKLMIKFHGRKRWVSKERNSENTKKIL